MYSLKFASAFVQERESLNFLQITQVDIGPLRNRYLIHQFSPSELQVTYLERNRKTGNFHALYGESFLVPTDNLGKDPKAFIQEFSNRYYEEESQISFGTRIGDFIHSLQIALLISENYQEILDTIEENQKVYDQEAEETVNK